MSPGAFVEQPSPRSLLTKILGFVLWDEDGPDGLLGGSYVKRSPNGLVILGLSENAASGEARSIASLSLASHAAPMQRPPRPGGLETNEPSKSREIRLGVG